MVKYNFDYQLDDGFNKVEDLLDLYKNCEKTNDNCMIQIYVKNPPLVKITYPSLTKAAYLTLLKTTEMIQNGFLNGYSKVGCKIIQSEVRDE